MLAILVKTFGFSEEMKFSREIFEDKDDQFSCPIPECDENFLQGVNLYSHIQEDVQKFIKQKSDHKCKICRMQIAGNLRSHYESHDEILRKFCEEKTGQKIVPKNWPKPKFIEIGHEKVENNVTIDIHGKSEICLKFQSDDNLVDLKLGKETIDEIWINSDEDSVKLVVNDKGVEYLKGRNYNGNVIQIHSCEFLRENLRTLQNLEHCLNKRTGKRNRPDESENSYFEAEISKKSKSISNGLSNCKNNDELLKKLQEICSDDDED